MPKSAESKERTRRGAPSPLPLRLLITGGSGYLAERLVPLAAEHESFGASSIVVVSRTDPGKAIRAVARWQSLDLLDGPAVQRLVKDLKPAAVINTAAANPGQGNDYAVNVVGAANIAGASAAAGARLVHVSSDIVHGGGDRSGNPAAPYADDAPPTPINDYGRSKAMGEERVLQADPTAAVVRTSLIYGVETMDRGTRGFVERLERGERLSLWSDAIRQPVWIDALCESLLALAVTPAVRGTINVAGSEAMSRADFPRRLLAYWGVDVVGRIDETSAAELGNQPLDLRLGLQRAIALGLSIPSVTEVLAGDSQLLRNQRRASVASSSQPERPAEDNAQRPGAVKDGHPEGDRLDPSRRGTTPSDTL